MSRDHTKLQVFHHAHALALATYRLAEHLPASERFGLQRQLRRAATSVPTNIAEGCARRSRRDYGHFIDIALGSAVEVRYLITLAVDLRLCSSTQAAECKESSDHVVRALQKLRVAVEQFDE
jgi:four helix bundle protein